MLWLKSHLLPVLKRDAKCESKVYIGFIIPIQLSYKGEASIFIAKTDPSGMMYSGFGCNIIAKITKIF